MSSVREFITKLGYKVDESGAQSYEKGLQSLATKVTGLGASMTAAITVPIVAMGTAMLRAASDATETDSKFSVVFRSVAEQATASAEELRKGYGLSRAESKGLLSDTGDLLTGFGFTQDGALKLSTSVQKLAVDLASFTNFEGGAKGASDRLTKALLGEREGVKALGIAILDVDVKKKMAEMKSAGQIFATERQAKAEATLAIAIEQSANAVGDYARTQDELANKSRRVLARINDLAVGFGKYLIPVANKLLDVGISLIDWLDNLGDGTKKFMLLIAGAAAATGPILLAIGAVTLALTFLNAEVLLLPAIIIAVIVAIGLLVEDIYQWKEGNESLIGSVLGDYDTFAEKIGTVFDVIKAYFMTWIAFLANIYVPIIENLKNAGAAIMKFIGSFLKLLSSLIKGDFYGVGVQLRNMFDAGVTYWKSIIKVFLSPFNSAIDTVLGGVSKVSKLFSGSKGKFSFSGLFKNIGEGLTSLTPGLDKAGDLLSGGSEYLSSTDLIKKAEDAGIGGGRTTPDIGSKGGGPKQVNVTSTNKIILPNVSNASDANEILKIIEDDNAAQAELALEDVGVTD